MHIELTLEQPGANALHVLRLLLPHLTDGERVSAAMAYYARFLAFGKSAGPDALYASTEQPSHEEA